MLAQGIANGGSILRAVAAQAAESLPCAPLGVILMAAAMAIIVAAAYHHNQAIAYLGEVEAVILIRGRAICFRYGGHFVSLWAWRIIENDINAFCTLRRDGPREVCS